MLEAIVILLGAGSLSPSLGALVAICLIAAVAAALMPLALKSGNRDAVGALAMLISQPFGCIAGAAWVVAVAALAAFGVSQCH